MHLQSAAALLVGGVAALLAPPAARAQVTAAEYGDVADAAAVPSPTNHSLYPASLPAWKSPSSFDRESGWSQVHQLALANYATVVDTLVGVEMPPYSVFYYDPNTMSDSDVTALASAYCSAAEPSDPGCVNEGMVASVAAGEFCGGVCGSTPTMVFKVESGEPDSRVQEAAVHEATHIFQIGNGAGCFDRDGGDDNEDWRGTGTRWFGEGTAMWLGEEVLSEYPQYFTPKHPETTNFGRTSAEACASLLQTEQARGLDLTNAIQASDEPWQAIWVQDQGGLDAYYQMVYEGGFCAVEFMVSDLPTFAEKASALLRVMANARLRDSWELAFLEEFTQYASMQQFYEAFEHDNGNTGFAYPAGAPPSSALSVLTTEVATECTADGTDGGTDGGTDEGTDAKTSGAGGIMCDATLLMSTLAAFAPSLI